MLALHSALSAHCPLPPNTLDGWMREADKRVAAAAAADEDQRDAAAAGYQPSQYELAWEERRKVWLTPKSRSRSAVDEDDNVNAAATTTNTTAAVGRLNRILHPETDAEAKAADASEEPTNELRAVDIPR